MSKSGRRLAGVAALGVIVSLVATACGGASGSEGSEVKWAFSLPTSWDPVTSRTGNDINTISLAYASLTRLDESGDVEPSLAESWEYDPTGTAVTFTLREGLTFSDGTALDAAAVKAFFDRGKTQEDSFLKDQLADVTEVTADSATDVTLKLAYPDYQIPYLVAGRTGAISSPAAASDTQKLSVWPVGAGPFKITEFVAEDHAYFEKNPDYWDAANINIDRFELTVAPDPATLVAGVQSGSIDFATLPALQAKEAEAAGLNVTVEPSLAANNVSINLNKAPFDNPKVVEAFRYAFDRQAFVDVITGGLGSTTSQPFPEGYLAFNPEIEDLWSYDPDRAVSLLQEAGYGPGQLSIQITAMSTATDRAELAQAQLKKIGVESTISVVPPGSSTWQSEVYLAKNPQLATDGTIGRESPVQNLLATYGPQGIMNLSGPHASPEFTAALEEVRSTPIEDPEYKNRLWNAVKVGVEQSPTNYLFSTPWIIVSNPDLQNLNILPSQVRWEGVTVS
ncbi:ABC transporter substrate-binding protein [Rhodococcoides kyotonense]|uniref:Peptide/nickel transport system substrate-binding protein n=1 Tax=Rhodococcoides kyotonense TaxID=398843 RepID=A0A239JDB6_9NOCA|nr:ABC transporter substrate-binding protein [Rhodococcus kyotonensis]SNT03592.1 peptide/nickel transport system substrate-binding protein [Rhodococcus kyotonensis]